MLGNHAKTAIVGAALCGLAVPAFAETSDDNLKAEMAALKAEMAQLRQAQGDNWLNERRAEEVKGLVHEVLSDAETRATLLQDGVNAGHDGKFYLQSNDGSFRLNVGGQMQFRYIWNHDGDRDDEDVTGFQFRRIKLNFDGHVGDPRIGYKVVLGTDRDSGDVSIDDAIISYAINDNWTVLGGKFKLPFLRQELVSSSRQIAVDRGITTDYFSVKRAEQIQLQYNNERLRVAVAFSDGANTGFSDYDSSWMDFDEDFDDSPYDAEYAFTGRVDYQLLGDDWNGLKQTSAQGLDTEQALAFIGAAAHYERNEDDFGDPVFGWTIDGSYQTGPLGLFAAVMGVHSDGDDSDVDQYGFLAEGGYMVNEQVEPFVRWEYLDYDDDGDELQAVTAGVNYYVRGHAAKFTGDVVWVYDGGVGSNSGLGLASSGDDDDQVVFRGQFQLLF